MSTAGPTQGVAIRTSGLTVSYGPVVAIEDVTLEVPRGVSVAVLGPNGCGKSTLLAAIAGLLEPDAGTAERSGSAGLLPQRAGPERPFPLSVRDCVRLGRWPRLGRWRRLGGEDEAAVDAAMDRLGIGGLAERQLGALSGGQRQRALLAQLVAEAPDVLLLDEPHTGVDKPSGDVVDGLIDGWRDEGHSVVVATHNLERARERFDLVVCLNRRVIAAGPPRTTMTEQALEVTFGGHVARVGDILVDTAHHHPGAA